jgi:ABC-type microcin C transport system permease subunit YejE
MDTKAFARDIIGVIIVIGAVASLFVPVVNDVASELIRFLSGAVIGYYFGAGTLPIVGAIKKS